MSTIAKPAMLQQKRCLLHTPGRSMCSVKPSTLRKGSFLFRLGLCVTRFFQCSEAFGFDSLAHLLLLRANDVSFFEWGLEDAAKKSSVDWSDDAKGKVTRRKRVMTCLSSWRHCFFFYFCFFGEDGIVWQGFV